MKRNPFTRKTINILNNQLPLQKNNFADLVTEKFKRAIIVGKLAASHLDLPYDSLQFSNIHKDILTGLHTGALDKANNLLSKHCEFSRSEFKRTISFPL